MGVIVFLTEGAPQSRNLDRAVVADYTAGVSRHREPGICVLADSETETSLLIVWMEKNLAANTTGYSEFPCRISGRKVVYTKATERISMDGAAFVVAEQASWVSGYGHQQGPHAYKIASGDNAGRVLCAYAQNDQAEEAWNGGATQDRNVYLTYSDDDGDTWSTGVKIVDKDDLVSPMLTTGIIVPGNGTFLQIPAGDYAGRICFPAYYNRSLVVYSDDGGDTWAVGGATPAVTAGTEPNLACRPDGTLVMTMRIDNTSDTRRWFTSADGGGTWTDEGDLPGYQGTACNAGLIQTDPAGSRGTYGKIVISGPEGSVGGASSERDHFALRAASDDAMTFGDRYAPLDEETYVGYSSVAFADDVLFLAFETGSAAYNIDERVEMMAIRYPD